MRRHAWKTDPSAKLGTVGQAIDAFSVAEKSRGSIPLRVTAKQLREAKAAPEKKARRAASSPAAQGGAAADDIAWVRARRKEEREAARQKGSVQR